MEVAVGTLRHANDPGNPVRSWGQGYACSSAGREAPSFNHNLSTMARRAQTSQGDHTAVVTCESVVNSIQTASDLAAKFLPFCPRYLFLILAPVGKDGTARLA
jgi:sirohydrochlorin ferrochelatase